ncbi:methionyl-tRNA formyltransferase [Candidatus Falkowbacteria bacterium]|nr:methionyl-tRNA formyltransferase [Candidatus Falkowbacteria bacterium]NCT55088.1 methionyl-tRNA formyltransferase [Candidatus Falkowbacteria bacterium]
MSIDNNTGAKPVNKNLKETLEKVKVLFMGTPEFSLPGFKALIEADDFEIVGVYTQSDKPVGRKQTLTAPPVKILAQEHGLKVFQPLKIKPELDNIKSLAPDLIVVIAYGKIIPQEILDIPKYGCINVHASLLPKYRGAACLNAPILNGDDKTGITIMKMEAGLDTGPIIKQAEITLNGEEKLKDVHDKLSVLGAEILVPTLRLWLEGKIKAQEQNDEEATYIKVLKKEDGKLDFNKNAEELERMIRAYNPWPGTYALLKGEALKIIEAKVVKENEINDQEILKSIKIGEIYQENKRLLAKCGQNYLDILKLQLPGKKPLSAQEFLNGNQDIVGKILE